MNHELRQAGLNFRSKRVETKTDFLYELQHHTPDVILSDHGLPSFDGFTALAIAKDRCPGVPFIFVTGSLGEEMAIETLKSGATDYVLKSHLIGLAPAVERAINEARKRGKCVESDTELRKNEELCRLVVGSIKDYAVCMLDTEGRVVFWNTGAQWIYGYTAEEVRGRNYSMFFPEDVASKRKSASCLKHAAREGRFENECLCVGKNQNQFMAHVIITSIHNGQGSLRGYSVVMRDITGQQRAEKELRRSEALKAAILDTALDAIFSIGHDGLIQEWNPAAQRIFGYTREEVLGKLVDDLIIPASLLEIYRDGVANYLIHGVGSLLGRPIELTLKRSDGSEFRAELAISRVPTENPPRCTALVRDITERKKAESALRESEERYRTMVEGVKDYAIYMLDPDGRVKTWNMGAERIKGYSAGEIIGQPFAVFFTPEDVACNMPAQLLKRAEMEGQAIYEGQRMRKNGQRFWIQGIVTALRDENGKLRGFSKVARDVTRQREADEQIRQLNEQLEQRVLERTAQLQGANQELEAFSYSVSHDLRAPLLHVSGYVEILKKEAADKLDDASRKYLQTIADGARKMSGLIDALLDFSRMGRVEMRHQRVNIVQLVEEARHELRHEIEGREIEWSIGDLPGVRGDPIMLRQVITNLLSNAVKYTRPRTPAKIEVGAKLENGETIYFVRDNGVGFDMQYSNKLFGVFQRLHLEREFEGTGIGLANVSRIIHRHGGRVWAESSLDGGATFYFTLSQPAERKEQNEKKQMDTSG